MIRLANIMDISTIDVIAIDVDDVIVKTNTGANGMLRTAWRNSGRTCPVVMPTAWDLPNWPEDARTEYFKLLGSEKMFARGLIDARIPVVLKKLRRDFIFITARMTENYDATLAQLQRTNIHFDPATQLFLTYDKLSVLGQYENPLLIDDGPHNVRKCFDNKIGAVMISNRGTTWNHYQRPNVPWRYSLIHALESYKLLR